MEFSQEMLEILTKCGVTDINVNNYEKMFKRLLLKYHPDQTNDEKLVSKFKIILNTYECYEEYLKLGCPLTFKMDCNNIKDLDKSDPSLVRKLIAIPFEFTYVSSISVEDQY